MILTADIGIFNNQYRYTIGVAGKHITVKSEGEGAPYSIGGKSMATVELSGDMTFDNVWLSLGQTAGRGGHGTISGFYANGYTAEFTENLNRLSPISMAGQTGKRRRLQTPISSLTGISSVMQIHRTIAFLAAARIPAPVRPTEK
ncbi:MAG TPA: hypothetical protein IAD48_05180 [Candidatus Limiplasma pullistercoris]|nr:hypothetical protein [Candidatus Limiplasma pullistercoris]